MTSANQRKNLRYPSDPDWTATILCDDSVVAALIVDESRRGCQLVCRSNLHKFEVSATYKIQVGSLPQSEATVVWLRPIDDDLLRVGFEYQNEDY